MTTAKPCTVGAVWEALVDSQASGSANVGAGEEWDEEPQP